MVDNRLLITGGTGFLGSSLCDRALQLDYRVTVLSRDARRAKTLLPTEVGCYQSLEAIPDLDAIGCILNLAGEPLAARRWSSERKKEFFASRVGTTQALFEHFKGAGVVPPVVISGSAIGYYGAQNDRVLDEAAEFRDCFSHQLCDAWEKAASNFSELGSRVCLLRTGIVLDKDRGALAKMLPPFRLGLGGPLGNGKQWMSWIHRDDFVALVFHCLRRSDVSGAVNATAPEAVTNQVFSRTLGKVLGRPAFFRMPSQVVKLMFGEMAKELLLSGQRVYPRKALETGFIYQYPELEGALRNILDA